MGEPVPVRQLADLEGGVDFRKYKDEK